MYPNEPWKIYFFECQTSFIQAKKMESEKIFLKTRINRNKWNASFKWKSWKYWQIFLVKHKHRHSFDMHCYGHKFYEIFLILVKYFMRQCDAEGFDRHNNWKFTLSRNWKHVSQQLHLFWEHQTPKHEWT